MKLALDLQIKIGHVAAAFDDLAAQLGTVGFFQPIANEVRNEFTALTRGNAALKISDGVQGQRVGSFL